MNNISMNYTPCPICKNIFLKTHIKVHYYNCRKRYEEKNNNYNNTNKQIIKINNNSNNLNNRINANYANNTNSINNTTSNKTQNEQIKYKKQVNSYDYLNDKSSKQVYPKLELENYVMPELVSYTDNILNHFFKEYNNLYSQFISGKCIALVGPAQSIIGTEKGSVIDKFDLVVRLNKSIPLPSSLKNDIGSRTDIVYNSLNISDFPGENKLSPQLYKKYGVKFVCSSYPFNHKIFHDDIANYVYKYKFELPFKVIDDLKFRNFERHLGTRPYTGTCAIMDLLSYPIKYLYITGLDFYQTKYYNEYRRSSKESLRYTKNNPIHQAKPQLDYLKHISFFDNRIILDTFLDKLLYHDYYKVVKNLYAFEKDDIYGFGDQFFQKYFEMKISNCTFTKNGVKNNDNSNSNLIFTDNQKYFKQHNEYCLLITNDKNMLNMLNNNLTSKKFIGNFFYKEIRINRASIYLTDKFLNSIKRILNRVGINNCNIYLAIMLSILMYLPDKHYFSYNEIFNIWNLTTEEKKLVLFMHKKKIINLIM
jgi:hypothetical protein